MRSSFTTRQSQDGSIPAADSIARRSRRLILPGLLTLAALVVLVSLGDWQVQRLAWKEDLIARATKRPSLPPLDLVSEDLADIGGPESFLEVSEYQRAVVSGEYDPAGEVRVFTSLEEPRGRFGGPGYWILTPLRAPGSDTAVYVNRGFVPEERKDDYPPPPAGTVTLTGLIRAPERGSWFTPAPDPKARVFYSRDPAKIAAATGGRKEVGFFVDLDASETPPAGLPQAGETRMSFPNDHLQYAVTWYGLAAALLAVFSVFGWQTLRRSDEKQP